MVNLLHARVVFEHLNIEHANCRIVALSHCRKFLSPCRRVASKNRFCHFVICHHLVLPSTGNQHI